MPNDKTTQDLLARLAGFTPGPWMWGSNFNGLDGPGGYEVIPCVDYEGMYMPEGPNAALIEAAPDLHRIACEQAAEIARLRGALETAKDYVEDAVNARGHGREADNLHKADLAVIRAALEVKP